jgi:hypothetical protein
MASSGWLLATCAAQEGQAAKEAQFGIASNRNTLEEQRAKRGAWLCHQQWVAAGNLHSRQASSKRAQAPSSSLKGGQPVQRWERDAWLCDQGGSDGCWMLCTR